ncbi:MAG: type III-B CRISPR module RAMP protein Cmr1 [Anaerolineales bacterium]
MNTRVPKKSPPEVMSNEKPGWVTEIRKYKVITPLYGGGEETQKADSITTVRASEVRGHLRFWWRATRGGQFDGDLKKMRDAEENIWGSSGEKGKPGPSKVSVRIINSQKGMLKKDQKKGDRSVHIAHPSADWSYVAFPLRESNGSVLEGVSFELEIRYPDKAKNEVETALWAWETFGGIGARTRRGFGALQNVSSPLFSMREVQEKIASGISSYVVDGLWANGVPHLSRTLRYVIKQDTNAQVAWEHLFKQLKSFRQQRFPSSGSPFGRSKWSEPDAIRRLPGMTSIAKHSKPRVTVDKFPRGKFGLPIIFKFKDEDGGDPSQTSLEGAEHDRLGSPLILRPLACSDGALGIAVILEWEPINSDEKYTPPNGLTLKSSAQIYDVKSDLTIAEAEKIEPLNLKGKPQPDILQAFLDYLK